jgi:hypothetical protein
MLVQPPVMIRRTRWSFQSGYFCIRKSTRPPFERDFSAADKDDEVVHEDIDATVCSSEDR